MRITLLVFVTSLFIFSSRSWAQVAVITADKDNTLYESGTGALSNGAGVQLFVGKTGATNSNKIRRALIHFNIAGAVPAGATITSATLQMRLDKGKTAALETINLHLLTADWGQGSSNASGQEGMGAASTSNDATWTHRFFSASNWTTPGGDFIAIASASQSMNTTTQTVSWSSAQMATDAQAWLDFPANNFGYIMIGSETASKTRRFMSRENASTVNRPRLTVNYTLPAPIVTADPTDTSTCNGDGVSFSISATNATSYVWQQNAGSWSNISNGGIFSGATTNTLNVSPVNLFMDGNQFRCIAIGTAPNDTSNAAVLSVSPSYLIPSTRTICNGDSSLIFGTWRKTAAVYSNNLTSSAGCDSIFQVTLTVNPTYDFSFSTSICPGDSVFLAGAWRLSAGIYSDTLSTVNTCDSIRRTTVSLNPTYLIPLTDAICSGDSIFLGGGWQSGPGTYYDTLATSQSCDSIIETVLSVTAFISSSASESICAGDSIFLGNNWQTTAATYNDTLPGIACDTIRQTTLTILNVPSVSISPGDTTLCTGQTVTLSASGGGTLQWYKNGVAITGATSNTHLVTTAGIYNMLKTNMNNCSDSATVGTTVGIIPCGGIREMLSQQLFTVTPNPSAGYFLLSMQSSDHVYQCSIYNAVGATIWERDSDTNQQELGIDLSDQPGGIYLLRIGFGEQVSTQRLVLSK